MKIVIFDINPDIVNTCKEILKDIPDIECVVQNFNEIDTDYVVTAGNSSGIMSGGIDLAVRKTLGIQIQDKVQHEIMYNWGGILPVGHLIEIPFNRMIIENAKAGLLIPSGVPITKNQSLLYVPTMEIPRQIDPEDIYFVTCKIFRHCEYALRCKYKSLAICGLGTATGGITAVQFASMVKRAYEDIFMSH